MRIGVKTFVLLSLFLGQCIGAPPQRVRLKYGYRIKTAYSYKEDEFIVEELGRLVDEHTQIFSRLVWDKLASDHREKCRQDSIGFPQERSMESLRGRFKHVLQYNRPGNVKVPEFLLEKLRTQRNSKGKTGKAYNAEERQLIFDELLKPSCKSLHGASTWETILVEHNKRRLEDKLPAFQLERTSKGLRSHVSLLTQKGLLPEEIVKKFRTQQQDASSSNPPNQQTDLQVTNDGRGGDEWVNEMVEDLIDNTNVDDMVEELLHNTEYEIDFSKLDTIDK